MDPQTAGTTNPDASKETVKEIHHYHYEGRRGGQFVRLFLGLLIVFLGFLFFAQNAGLVTGLDFGYVLSRLWPVFIILAGLSLLNRGGVIGNLLTAVITLFVFGILAYAFLGTKPQNRAVESQDFSVAKMANIESAEVQIKAGAAKILVRAGTDAVASGKLESNFTRLETQSTASGKTQNVVLETKGEFQGLGKRNVNNLEVMLSMSLPTKLTIDSGASDLNVDLSNIVLRELNLDTGASSLNLILGNRAQRSRVAIDAGASAISITLPRDAGARINANAPLSVLNFADFRKVDGQTFESQNYASAERKIDIVIEAGASSIGVVWK